MKLDFAKLNGCGNDFVFIDGMQKPITLTEDQVRTLCDRHFGIGADGVIVVEPPQSNDACAFMNYINADGTFAEMCGNGVRCFAKYLVDRGIVPADKNELIADTRAGQRKIIFKRDDGGSLTFAKVNMGCPHLLPESIPVTLEPNACTDAGEPFIRDEVLISPWGEFRFTCVSMGNPHAVCFLDDLSMLPDVLFNDSNDRRLATLDVDAIGAFFESHEAFPAKTNVEFACIEPDGISMRVYERGCGETLACGTGACATGVAAYLTGRAGRHSIVHLLGGDLDIDWLESGDVMMEGSAAESFRGTVSI